MSFAPFIPQEWTLYVWSFKKENRTEHEFLIEITFLLLKNKNKTIGKTMRAWS